MIKTPINSPQKGEAKEVSFMRSKQRQTKQTQKPRLLEMTREEFKSALYKHRAQTKAQLN